MLRIRSRQGGDGWCREISWRVQPRRRRRQKVVLVVGHPLSVLMPMRQGLRVARSLSLVLVMSEGMRPKAEHLRHGYGGQDEEGGETSTQRHAGIVDYWSAEVKPPESAAAAISRSSGGQRFRKDRKNRRS